MWSVDLGDSCARDYDTIGADTLVYDPPWELDLVPAGGFERYNSILAFTDARRLRDTVERLGAPTWSFVWDCVSSWFTRNRPLQRHKLCLWYGPIDRWDSDAFFAPRANPQRTTRNSRGKFVAGDARGVRLTDLYSAPITRLHGAGGHRHSKPIEWLEYLIACTGASSVYDPFCGSGAAIVAAQRRGVPAVGVDVDPASVCMARQALLSSAPAARAPAQMPLL